MSGALIEAGSPGRRLREQARPRAGCRSQLTPRRLPAAHARAVSLSLRAATSS